MPSSNYKTIETILGAVRTLNPIKTLDIGIGFGKYGFLLREYLELWDGRNKYNDWVRTIDGIEVFKPYVTPLQELIYDWIGIGDALAIVPKLENTYDLILILDVIEHFTKTDGLLLLDYCKQKSKNILISTPKNVTNQGIVFNNSYEQHLTQWDEANFATEGTRFYYNIYSIIALMEGDVNV